MDAMNASVCPTATSDVRLSLSALLLFFLGAFFVSIAIAFVVLRCLLKRYFRKRADTDIQVRYSEVRADLGDMDEALLGRLSDRDIRLLNREWLVFQHESNPSFRLPKRQDLEKMRFPSARPAFLRPEEAVAAVEAQDRSVCVISYAWTTPKDPDPSGEYLRAVCAFLRERK